MAHPVLAHPLLYTYESSVEDIKGMTSAAIILTRTSSVKRRSSISVH